MSESVREKKIRDLQKVNDDLLKEINDSKLRNEILLKNQDLYNAILGNVSSGVALIDGNGRFTLYNQEFLRLFGLAEESTIKNVNDQNWSDWQVFNENMEKLHVDEHPVRKAALLGKKVKNLLVAVKLPSVSDLTWMLISAEPIFREDGTIEKTICTYQDITVIKAAEEALRESEERLRIALDVEKLGTWDLDLTTGIAVHSLRHDQIFGYHELQPEWTFELAAHHMLPEFQQIFRDAFLIAEKTGVLTFEGKVRWPDGSIHWIYPNGIVHYDDNGKPVRMVGVVADITESKIAEEKLRESEERYRAIFESSIDAMLITTPEGGIETANDAALRMFEMTREELISGGRNAVVDFSDPRLNAALRERNRTGRFRGELNLKKKDGTIFPVDESNVVFTDKQGSNKTVMILRDITERKKAENSLRETQEKLNIALENGNIGIWEWNLKTGEVIWDKRMENMFGLKPGSFEGTYKAFERLVNDEDLSHIQKELNKSIEKDLLFETVYRTKLNSGKSKYISTKALISKDEQGEPIKMSGVCFDVTGLKEGTEKLISRLNEDLLRSNSELQSFAYVASHDLQEPLRMVSSFTQLLSMQYGDKLDDNAKEYIDFAVEGAKRMYDLLNGLLAFSRIETKNTGFNKIALSVALENATKNLSLKIAERNAVISAGKLPVVPADKSQMTQLFQNLIENSIKFSKNSPRIYISSKSEKNYYIISVRDEGMGIESQYFNRIFQIFQRLMPKNEFEGTGIGLAICKRIVERHGGKIWVESVPDNGSTFSFTISK